MRVRRAFAWASDEVRSREIDTTAISICCDGRDFGLKSCDMLKERDTLLQPNEIQKIPSQTDQAIMSEDSNQTEAETVAEDAITEPSVPTQAQLYDDLRRIGQLEDQKLAIQQEIDQRTDRLRSAIPTLDKSSLLFKMLSSAIAPAKPEPRRTVTKKTTSKRAKKSS